MRSIQNPHAGEVAQHFFDVASNLLTHPEERTRIAPQLANKPLYRIHPGKIDPTLAKILEEHDLAKKVGGADWAIEPVIAGVYMMLLAQHMAGTRPLITDNSAYQRLLYRSFSTDWPVLSKTIDQPDESFKLVATVCRTVIPVQLQDVPIEKLLEVRDRFAEHRERFQERVAELARALEGLSDEEVAAGKIGRQVEAISDEVENIRDRLLSQQITLGSTLLALAIPVTAAVEGNFSMALASGAIAVGAGAVRFFLERRITERSPWMYLVDISKALSPVRLASQLIELRLGFDGPFDFDPRGRRVA